MEWTRRELHSGMHEHFAQGERGTYKVQKHGKGKYAALHLRSGGNAPHTLISMHPNPKAAFRAAEQHNETGAQPHLRAAAGGMAKNLIAVGEELVKAAGRPVPKG